MPKSPDFKRNKTIGDLVANTRKPKLLPETGWYRAAITELFEGQAAGGQYLGSSLAVFKNDWRSVAGTSNAPFSWYLSKNGEVRFRGKITGGQVGTTILTLPPEIRPEYAETFIVAMDSGEKANIVIAPNGNVTVESMGDYSGLSSVYVEKATVTHADDLDTGEPLFTVTVGDVLLDWWFTIETGFAGFTPLGYSHLYFSHSPGGGEWKSEDGSTNGRLFINNSNVNETSGGFSNSTAQDPSMSNTMANQDTNGRWQTTITTAGTLVLKAGSGDLWSTATAGSMTVYLMRCRARTV